MTAAAFGRLCVETRQSKFPLFQRKAAAFGRLCVETNADIRILMLAEQPPSGGCVLKLSITVRSGKTTGSSRLRAAVC